jgi:hypothetical protein
MRSVQTQAVLFALMRSRHRLSLNTTEARLNPEICFYICFYKSGGTADPARPPTPCAPAPAAAAAGGGRCAPMRSAAAADAYPCDVCACGSSLSLRSSVSTLMNAHWYLQAVHVHTCGGEQERAGKAVGGGGGCTPPTHARNHL